MRTVWLEPLGTKQGKAGNAWIKALGLRLDLVKAHQGAVIDNDTVSVVVFDEDEHGQRIPVGYDKDENWLGFRKHTITVPLTADPADYGLTVA